MIMRMNLDSNVFYCENNFKGFQGLHFKIILIYGVKILSFFLMLNRSIFKQITY